MVSILQKSKKKKKLLRKNKEKKTSWKYLFRITFVLPIIAIIYRLFHIK